LGHGIVASRYFAFVNELRRYRGNGAAILATERLHEEAEATTNDNQPERLGKLMVYFESN
jgi:hypothetical protein